MPVHSVSAQSSTAPSTFSQAEIHAICTAMEHGTIVYFPKSPIDLPLEDANFLLHQHQTSSRRHKNIAYKPAVDRLSGVDKKSMSANDFAQLESIMRRFSQSVANYLEDLLCPYQGGWQLDYTSFRPFEEKNRDLPLRHRNDLLHTDAFPTRPTRGARILRFFLNLHPERTRDWICTESFERVVRQFTPARLPVPRPLTPIAQTGKNLAATTGLSKVFPKLARTPYDDFMMRLHDTMKEDSNFQQSCPKEHFRFPPGSSWMVYTETVPHAVIAGQFALEQTFLVNPASLVHRDSAPLSILESMAGARLT